MKKLLTLQIAALSLLLLISVAVACSIRPAKQDQPAMADTVPNPVETVPETTAAPTTEPEPQWMTFPASRAITAQQYFVYDVDQDEFLKRTPEGGEKVYPASVTKLFTASVAMEYLEAEQEVVVGDSLDMVVWGSSVAELEKGDKLTVDLLVESMLLPSGNDAAYTLAVEAGRVIANDKHLPARSAVDVFVKKMNEKAREMGMDGTRFVNPDGIHDENHYTDFEDLTILGKMALENDTIMKNAGTSRDKAVLASGEKKWENTNALVDEKTPYFCPYAIGLKTGQTPSAGSCLLSAFRMDGKTLLIGVFGCPEEEDRFEDTLQLFNEAMGI